LLVHECQTVQKAHTYLHEVSIIKLTIIIHHKHLQAQYTSWQICKSSIRVYYFIRAAFYRGFSIQNVTEQRILCSYHSLVHQLCHEATELNT